MQRTNYLWHYSALPRLAAIMDSGFLKPGNVYAPGETPMLWFSANQHWENTATKMVKGPSGLLMPLTFQQQAKRFGCIRFGLPWDDLRILPWKAACSVAGTPREVRRSLEASGKKIGGKSEDWFATSVTIGLEELHFQVWRDGWFDELISDCVKDRKSVV